MTDETAGVTFRCTTSRNGQALTVFAQSDIAEMRRHGDYVEVLADGKLAPPKSEQREPWEMPVALLKAAGPATRGRKAKAK